MELTLEQVLVLEMELCVLLLETLDTRVLGPPKMQEGEEEEGLQVVGQPKVDGWIAHHPKQDWCSHGGWFTQAL